MRKKVVVLGGNVGGPRAALEVEHRLGDIGVTVVSPRELGFEKDALGTMRHGHVSLP